MCFGNRNDLETGAQIDVNVAEVKDYAARSNCTAVEGTSLVDVLEGICTELESFRKRNAGVGDSDASTSVSRFINLVEFLCSCRDASAVQTLVTQLEVVLHCRVS